MKKLLAFLTTLFLPLLSFAQDEPLGLDERVNNFIQPATTWISDVVFVAIPVGNGLAIPVVLILLLLAATYFTIYFGFPNFTRFGLAVNVVRGKYDSTKEKIDPKMITRDGDIPDTIRVEGGIGEVTPFQALTSALSATVGLGNIAGVAIAIAIGGPGATFWMILAGFLGMASKFTECTLGVKYREIGPDGTVYGGPMYYLSKGLGEKGMGAIGKIMAAFYAVMLIGGSFGGGNMFQSNQAAAQFKALIGSDSGMAGTLFGVVLALLVAIVIIGGIKRIGKVAEKIVPTMVGIYVGAALFILIYNFNLIPNAFSQIINGAFTGAGISGGIIGVLIQGFKRAAFSNEAGVGSASVAHSAVKTKYPASEGVVALLEPFIDTVLVCTMTALVIIIFNSSGGGLFEYGVLTPDNEVVIDGIPLEGVGLTSAAFNSVIPGFSYVLTLAVVLFAFSTMLSWSYYGLQAWMYLFGRSKRAEVTYKVLFCVFIIIGAASSLKAVTDFSDAMVFAMVFPNMIGLFILAPVVKEELKKYLDAISSGALDADKK